MNARRCHAALTFQVPALPCIDQLAVPFAGKARALPEGVAYGSFELATRTDGNGNRPRAIMPKRRVPSTAPSCVESQGATNKAPKRPSVARRLSAPQAPTARQPRLCAAKATGLEIPATALSIHEIQSSGQGCANRPARCAGNQSALAPTGSASARDPSRSVQL